MASPGYPNPESQALTCRYVISVAAGFTISLNFSDSFHIESISTQQGVDCLYHWLQVMLLHRPEQRQNKERKKQKTSITHLSISIYRCPFRINSRLSCAVTRVQV